MRKIKSSNSLEIFVAVLKLFAATLKEETARRHLVDRPSPDGRESASARWRQISVREAVFSTWR